MPVIALFLLSLLWGSTFYFTKIVLPDFHPFSIVFYRCLFGAAALFPFFIWKGNKEEFQRLPILLSIALMNAAVPWSLMSYSQQELDTTISAVLNATVPIFGLMFSALILKMNIRWKEFLGILIGFTGIVTAFFLGPASGAGFEVGSASLLITAAIFYSLSSVLITKYLQHVSVFTLSFMTMVIGTVVAGGLMAAVQPQSIHQLAEAENLAALLILGVFNSGIGNVIFFYLVKSGGPIFAMLITFLMPITTIFLGVLFLNESLNIGTMIALILVLVSVYITQNKGGKKDMEFQEIVSKLMKNNFFVDRNIRIFVLTDQSTRSLGEKFAGALQGDGWNVALHIMEDRNKSGEEPPSDAANAMLQYDLVFCLTKHSLTHTEARKNANAKGISVITMPGITEDMFLHGAMSADYSRVEKETLEMTDRLTAASKVTIYTGDNHKLIVPVEGRSGVPSTGVFRKKAASGNLPSGEAFIAPLEGKAEGTIEINGSIAGIGLLDSPIVLTIKEGRLIHATGEDGAALLKLLGEGDGRMLAELGIGTNYAARITGNILEDEKAYNTIHVAFGSNHTFGGTIKADVHIDCVTKNPTIEME